MALISLFLFIFLFIIDCLLFKCSCLPVQSTISIEGQIVIYTNIIHSSCSGLTIYENKGAVNFSNNSFDEHNTNNFYTNGKKNNQQNEADENSEKSNKNDASEESESAHEQKHGLYVKNNNGFINMGKMDKPSQSIGSSLVNGRRGNRESREARSNEDKNVDERVEKATEDSNKNSEISSMTLLEIDEFKIEMTEINDETEIIQETTTQSMANKIEEMQNAFLDFTQKPKRRG
ncbi:phosphatidylinositol 3,4,5-trisphosphate 3-phosphatase cnrN-like [Chironomus tepperi]|uniref:phosphatidylinositol 3,4,5-trisphosphate 3-phosphatase cnrN-like n=1 Tax=Chironomus tepperi TaxID=113505 RepID=UPI00391F2CE3